MPTNSLVPSNALKATISDNETSTVALKYKLGATTGYFGWENIEYMKPAYLPNGPQTTIGGYPMVVSNSKTTFPKPQILQVTWLGAKVAATDNLDLMAAYYRYDQASFASKSCHKDTSSQCSGTEEVGSLVADYKFDKRFDAYGGVMYSVVEDGLAAGYLQNNTTSTTVGMRFNF